MLPLLPSEGINGHKGDKITNFVIKKKKKKKQKNNTVVKLCPH